MAVLLSCANTLSYIHGLSGSYDTESWKYDIINLRFSKLQQIFRPRITLLIQVHPKKVYSREEIPTGLRQGSIPRRLRQLRLAINCLTNCATTLPPPPKKKEFHETLLGLIALKDPSDRVVLLSCANTLSYIHGQSGSYDTKAWKYYKI